MVKSDTQKTKPVHPFALPDLTEFEGETLEAAHDYDAILFKNFDFTGIDAAEARFLECRLERCCVEGLSLKRARVVGSVIADAYGSSVDCADSTWRDSLLSGGRLGAMLLPGATLNDVRVHGMKLGFLNFAGARLEDVVFEECEIGSLDVGAAQLKSVSFVDCSVEELTVAEARLEKVDLSGARLKTLIGVEHLRGAIVGHDQLLDLAPQLAAQLGIEVRPD
jgi:uncharacterized protein YjbI with pentapeptide repeats